MKRSLVVGPESFLKHPKFKVLTIFVLAALALAMMPERALAKFPENRNTANPRMAARLKEAQKQRNLNGPNLAPAPPIRGSQPTLFILIESTSSTVPFYPWGWTAAPFNDRFRDPSHWTGLMKEADNYYNEVSRGIMRIVPGPENFGTLNDGIIGPLTVPDLQGITSSTAYQDLLTWEAINAANPYVNFGAYDTNLDGMLDSTELHLVIIQSGYELAPFYPNTPTPNAAYGYNPYPPAYYDPALDSDNIWITSYMYMGSEFYIPGASSERAHVGSLVKMLAHDIGLPDTSGGGMWAGLGWHCLTAWGFWGDQGRKPVHLCGFLKSYLFWGQETDVMAPTNQNFSLPASVGTNALVRVNIPNSYEFFVVENRQQYGYDEGLPGTQGGLAIYACDAYAMYFYPGYSINYSPTWYAIKLMQADGSKSMETWSFTPQPPFNLPFSLGSDRDYYRIGNNTAFTRLTNPSSVLKNLQPSNVEIGDISASGPVMTFSLNHGNTFSMAASTLNVREEQKTANVLVNLDRPAENVSTIEYAATAIGNATPLSPTTLNTWDFHLPSGMLTFEPGTTSKYFTVTLNNDAQYENTEWVMLRIRNPKGGILNTSASMVMLNILDNDRPDLNLVSPNGGGTYYRNSKLDVKWIGSPIIGTEVRIDLFKDGAFFMTLPGAYHVPNTGQATVSLPADLPVSYRYRMAVTAVNDESITDQSDENFAILDPNLKVLSVTINGGITPATSRNVNLDILVPEGLVFSQWIASENSNFAGAVWHGYGSSTQFTLTSPGDGYKRVWVKIRNSGAQESVPVSGVTVLQEVLIAPVIKPIANATTPEHQTYYGPKPTLLDGNLPPIVWSMVSGPPGVSINPETGVVTWKDPRVEYSPATIKIRAVNKTGKSGTISWTVTVKPGELKDALDCDKWAWTTSGNAGWYYQTSVTHDGIDAARSRTIGNSQKAVLSATVTGPGVVGFWWKVSSEANFDKATFMAGSTKVAEISGTKDWTYVMKALPVGTTTLTWTYAKDSANSAGSDTCWIDQVTWQPGLQVTNITRAGYVVDAVGIGKKPFIDSTVAWVSPMPATLEGQVMIRTADQDRNYYGTQLLGFYVDRPVDLVLALDSRFTALPSWATGFTKLGFTMKNSGATMNLYAKTYPAGKIVLGGTSDNRNPNNYQMYSVIMIPSNPVTVTGISNTGYAASYATAGWRVMGDQGAVFTAPIPKLFDGASSIRTLGADANRSGLNFLSFYVGQPVTVLVGFDGTRGVPPSWAAGWQAQSEMITATDVPRKLYAKRFGPGRIYLGGNVNAGDTGSYRMYTVLVLPSN